MGSGTATRSVRARQRSLWARDAFLKPLRKSGIWVDGFAGGGGASKGIRLALGRDVDIAINHDNDAIAMHQANHPDTRHYCENIWNVDPMTACEGRQIAGAWFSPDCTHFSKARGKAPVKKEIRGLAQAIIPWASMPKKLRPRVIFVENVVEFLTWGPIDDETGQPIKERAGETFRLWVCKLEELGYVVEWRELVASDYGAPTTRKRLFIIARCDGKPIVWPDPTHGSPAQIAKELKVNRVTRRKPGRTAADIIDWSIPCPSIFLSAEEAKAAGCKRPLAEKTLARIAEGIKRYVIGTPDPFIVRVNHGGDHWRGQQLDQPLGTNTNKNGFGLVAPTIVSYYGPKGEGEAANHRGRQLDQPIATVTTENRFGLVSAFLSSTANQGTTGRAPYCWPLEEPVRTLTTSGDKILVSPYMVSLQNKGATRSPLEPCRTITASDGDCNLLVSAFIAKHFGGMVGIGADRPFPTITTIGTQNNIVAANMIKLNDGYKNTFACDEPLRTVLAGTNHNRLVTTHLKEVRAFLLRFYGQGGQWSSMHAPTPTITTKDRLALGIVMVHGQPWQIVDIGMRMLSPRELFCAQGFPADYHISSGEDGKPLSKSAQVARCGNSVPPPFAEALVRANLPEMCV